MINLNEVISSPNTLHCVYRQGYVFTSIDNPANVLDAIVIRAPEDCDCWSPQKSHTDRTLEEIIEFVNVEKLEKAFIIAEDLSFLDRCASLKHIEIIPADSTSTEFDYSPLSKLPHLETLTCKTRFGGPKEHRSAIIDFSELSHLRNLNLFGDNHCHCDKLTHLDVLEVSESKKLQSISCFSSSIGLRKMSLTHCGLKALHGISNFRNLQELSLAYCRTLEDVNSISTVSSTLRSLNIESCPQIQNFDFLGDLKNLEYLFLSGSNSIPNLNFLNQMSHLKVFVFSIKVVNGDLSPCMQIPYVSVTKGKKNYNMRDSSLPKQLPTEDFTLH